MYILTSNTTSSLDVLRRCALQIYFLLTYLLTYLLTTYQESSFLCNSLLGIAPLLFVHNKMRRSLAVIIFHPGFIRFPMLSCIIRIRVSWNFVLFGRFAVDLCITETSLQLYILLKTQVSSISRRVGQICNSDVKFLQDVVYQN